MRNDPIGVNQIVFNQALDFQIQSLLNAASLEITKNVDSAVMVDKVVIGGYDIAAGHRALSISCEEVAVNAAPGAADWYIPVRINGVTFKLELHS
jgi:hypothetical protein